LQCDYGEVVAIIGTEANKCQIRQTMPYWAQNQQKSEQKSFHNQHLDVCLDIHSRLAL
jgi:hypothetical protein